MPPHATPLPLPGRRIVVIGTTGSGKTTLARRLSEQLGLPHIELDALHWEPGWTPAGSVALRERTATAVLGDAWVVDGNYSIVRDIVWSRTDTVVFLDYSLTTILSRLIPRTLRRIRTREELWNGNRERLASLFRSDSIILWALRTHRRHRREYRELLREPEYAHLRVVHICSPLHTDEWLRRITRSERVR